MKPEAFAAVMATGIVSISAADRGLGVISWPLAALAALGLPVLMWCAVLHRKSFDLRRIDTVVALFTYVAACTVVASRLAVYRPALWGLGALGLLGWLPLALMLVVQMSRLGLIRLCDRARGAWELPGVATSGLAIVFSAAGITFLALVFWLIALGVYCFMTMLVAWRALLAPEVRRNVPPDHWILMGGVSIATLAGVDIHATLEPGRLAQSVWVVTLVTIVIATVQIAPLAVAGWRQMLDWPAVFPLGMYSAASYSLSIETGWHPILIVSHVFFWAAFVAWALVVALIVRGLIGSRRSHAAGTQ